MSGAVLGRGSITMSKTGGKNPASMCDTLQYISLSRLRSLAHWSFTSGPLVDSAQEGRSLGGTVF